MDIKGTVALVTGGGTGIGRAAALALARYGARAVVITYASSVTEAEETCRELHDLGVEAAAVKADVRDEEQVRALLSDVEDQFGELHLLINNAGVTKYTPLVDLEALTDEIWNLTFDTNLRGTFYCSRAAAPLLKASRGAIINVASIAGMRGAGSSIAYSVSKAGVIQLTKVLAVAMAPEVTVNCVAPGYVQTRWLERGVGKTASDVEEVRVARNTPSQRTATADDVANTIVGLIISSGVTGETLVLDGGKSLTY